MKKLLFICTFILINFGLSGNASAAGYFNIPGTACAPFNNALADRLQRNHIRLQNPVNSGISMWVMCPIQSDLNQMASTASMPFGYIHIFRQGGSNNFDDTHTTCHIRQFDGQTAAVPGMSTAGQNFSLLVTIPSIPAGTTDETFFQMPSDSHLDNYNEYYGVMCFLKPGLGINSITIYMR